MTETIQLRKFTTPYPNPHDHGNWRACPGVPMLHDVNAIQRQSNQDRRKYCNRLAYCSRTDQAWIVCLYKAGVLDRPTAAKVLGGLQKLLDSGEMGQGGEVALIPVLNHDEDLASVVNLGRTMQEPMSRLQMRDMLNDFLGCFRSLPQTRTRIYM